MSLSSLRTAATCWDTEILGKGIRSLRRLPDGTNDYYELSDRSRNRPLEVLHGSVVRDAHASDSNCASVWHLTEAGFPAGCGDALLLLPAAISSSRDVRVPNCVVIGSRRVPPRSALEALTTELKNLQTLSDPLVITLEEPLIRVGFASNETEYNVAYVVGMLMGPRLRITLTRTDKQKLRLISMDGGPDGSQDVAAELLEDTIYEVKASTDAAAAAAEAAKEAAQPFAGKKKSKKIFIFGRAYDQPLQSTTTGQGDAAAGPEAVVVLDPAVEAVALWQFLQGLERTLREEPWNWQLHWLEVDGDTFSPSSTPRRSRSSLSPSLSGPLSLSSVVRSPLAPRANRALTRGFRTTTTNFGTRANRDSLLALLRGFDRNGSGTIDWPEFRAGSWRLVEMLGAEGNWTEEIARQEFDTIDCNGDGVLHEEEWVAFAGQVLSVLSGESIERVLTLLGEDTSMQTFDILSGAQGEVEVGLTCQANHSICPLRLRPWGAELANELGLQPGFRCAEVNDPAVFVAAWGSRCTRCRSADSRASFAVSCGACGMSGFKSGWWCTRCVAKAGCPRDRSGRHLSLVFDRFQGASRSACRHCSQTAVIGWRSRDDDDTGAAAARGDADDFEPLCNEHAADRLLEEAARHAATSGRDSPDGASLAAIMELELRTNRLEMNGVNGEAATKDLALRVEEQIVEALGLDGLPPGRSQVEVQKLQMPDRPGNPILVELVLTRLYGKPSPFELAKRLHCLAVDLDGPIYTANFSALSAMANIPRLAEVLVSNQVELPSLTERVVLSTHEGWIHAMAEPDMAIVAQPQRHEMPFAITVRLLCRAPNFSTRRYLEAYVAAFTPGVRDSAPQIHEFATAFAEAEAARTKQCTSPRKRVKEMTKAAAKPDERKKISPPSPPPASMDGLEACGKVYLCEGRGGLLEGSCVLFGMRPGAQYDVFAAVLRSAGEAGQPQDALAVTKQTYRTCEADNRQVFGADERGIVELLTEEGDVRRSASFLDLMDVREAPCIIDQATCKLTCRPFKDSTRCREVMKEHGLHVVQEEAEPSEEGAAASSGGGVLMPVAVLSANPSRRAGDADIEVVLSADMVVQACNKHGLLQDLELPRALGLRGRTTTVRCCRTKGGEVQRCTACTWSQITTSRRIPVRISNDIMHMIQAETWNSVRMRMEHLPPQVSRSALAVMLSKHSDFDKDFFMDCFERALGRDHEVDFPVRADGATALHVAIEEKHLEVVKSLLRRGLDVTFLDNMGQTALHAVARSPGSMSAQLSTMLLNAVRPLWRGKENRETDILKMRQDLLDGQDLQGRTALHLAAAANNRLLVSQLLKAKASTHIYDNSGFNVLQVAAAAGGLQCVSVLLGAPGLNIDDQSLGEKGFSPLHLACMRCNAEVALSLLQRGADTNKLSSDGKHALCLLMEGVVQWGLLRGTQGAIEVVRALLRRGRPSEEILSAAGAAISNLTMWHSDEAYVIETAQTFISLLGEGRCDLKAAFGIAMLHAVSDAVGEVDPQLDERRVAHSQTLGTAAVRLPGAVNFALRLGANANATSNSGQTALHMLMGYIIHRRVLPDDQAAGEAIADSVRALLDQKADLRIKDQNGETALSALQQLEDMGQHYAASWTAVVIGPTGGKTQQFRLPSVSNTLGATTPRTPKRVVQVRLPALGAAPKAPDPAPSSARERRGHYVRG